MPVRHLHALALAGLVAATALYSQTNRVLWIGNSYTQASPGCRTMMCETATNMINNDLALHGFAIESEYSIYGGKALDYHWNETDVRARISTGNFDYVVVQGYSFNGSDNYESDKSSMCTGRSRSTSTGYSAPTRRWPGSTTVS
jgi:hypothetical protein